MKFFLPIILLASFYISCKSEKTQQIEVTPSPTSVENKATTAIQLTSITPSMMDTMYNMVDYVDYLWPSLPISTSLDSREDIKLNIGLISTTPQATIPSNCKPLGRKFFNIKGNTFASADIYFSEGCKFYVFLNGEKPIYANLMTQDAIAFYNAILEAGKQPPIK